MRTSTSCAATSLPRCPVAGSDRAIDRRAVPGDGNRILIVGATGVLLPAVNTCLARGDTVVAVARDPERLAELARSGGTRLLPVSLDIFDPEAVLSAIAAAPLEAGVEDALLYVAGPDDETENVALAALCTVVRRRSVRILTSRWTPAHAPDLGGGRWPAAPGRVHLLLGRQSGPGPAGDAWHTAEQISAAAVAALDGGADAILGRPVSTGSGDR